MALSPPASCALAAGTSGDPGITAGAKVPTMAREKAVAKIAVPRRRIAFCFVMLSNLPSAKIFWIWRKSEGSLPEHPHLLMAE